MTDCPTCGTAWKDSEPYPTQTKDRCPFCPGGVNPESKKAWESRDEEMQQHHEAIKNLKRFKESMREPIDIVFDGPPSHEAPRFVEVEKGGQSIKIGEWVERDDGYWVLRFVPEDLVGGD